MKNPHPDSDGFSLPHLSSLTDCIMASQDMVLERWVYHPTVRRVLSMHHIQAETFLHEYATEVFDYFVQVIHHKQQIGRCPAITRLLNFCIAENITVADVYNLCIHFREALIGVLFEKDAMHKALFDELSLVFDANLSGLLQAYTATIAETQKQAESFQTIIENSLNEIYVFDRDSLRFTYANRGAVENSGYSADELQTMHPYDIKPFFDAAQFRDMITPLLNDETERLVFETIHERKDGSLYDVDIRLQSMRFDHKEHLVAIINDITEQKKAHRLAEDYLMNDAIIHNSTDGIVSVDEQQRITLFNASAEQMFGHTSHEVIGRPLDVLLPEALIDRHRALVVGFGQNSHFRARMADGRAEVQGKHKDGHLIPMEVSISKSRVGGKWLFTALIRDVSERHAAEAEMRRLAKTDWMTGLANRHHFDTELKAAISYARRFPDHKVGLIFLDLDHFKDVNDTHGHATGDQLLKQVADILQNNVRDFDLIGRLGGDEFGIIARGIQDQHDVMRIAEKLTFQLSQPLQVNHCSVQIGVSIGITFCPEQGHDQDRLMLQADQALYEAKKAGRNTYRLYQA
jgi:diguanylate cyclase (GGDEF)-like protein/PAS domain S-box-containing protein